MIEKKVSAPQFFSLLFLSLLSTVFMYVSSTEVTIAETETILRPLVFVLISVLVSVPSYFIFKEYKNGESNGIKVEKRLFFKVIALIYALVYFIGSLRSIARFDLFASSELFPGSEMTFFIIGIIVACGLLSSLGLGALCRGGVVFTFLVVAVTGFVMVSLKDEINILNFTPLFREGIGNFFFDSLLLSVQATELGAIILFLPEIRGKVKKHFFGWLLLSALSFSAIFFFVIGSLGPFADTQLFPTYSSVTLADFGLLKRIDALETSIWIFCVVEKISFYILIVTRGINYAFGKVPSKYIRTGICVILSCILVFISGNVKRFAFMSDMRIVSVLYALVAFLLPVAVLIYLKKVKPYEKISENN